MLLISPLVSQEAVLSSKLEGTHATIADFINYDAGNEVSIPKDEMQEAMNYRSALFYVLDKMSTISDNSEWEELVICADPFSCFFAYFNHVRNGHPRAVIAALSGVNVLLDELQITVAPAVLLAEVQGKPIRNRKYLHNKKRNEHPFRTRRPYSVTKPISWLPVYSTEEGKSIEQ